MKKQIIYISLLATGILSILGCYKDKGNYDYNAINQITLSSTADTFNVLVPDALKIDLTVTQTNPGNAGIGYEWVMYPSTSAPLTRRTLDTTQNLNAKITEDPGTYILNVFAKDRQTGVEVQKKFVVNVLTKFSEGWVVVEEKGAGCDMALITPTDVIFKDIYSGANSGQLLPAGTSRIPEIKTNRNEQKFFVLSPNNVIQLHFANFLKIANPSDMFWQVPNPLKPVEYFVNSDNETLISDGKFYYRNLINAGVNKLNLPAPGTFYVAPFDIYSVSTGVVFFDTLAQKFAKMDGNTLNLLPFAADPADAFDMNNIGKRILYAEVNTGNSFYAFFKKNTDDSLFAYNFNLGNARPPVSIVAGLNAPGMHTAKYFVMSRSLPHLYYAAGNQIYKLDIPAKTATPVYTFPGGTEIRAMKMYRNVKTSTDPNNNKLIAVATLENGTEGKIYTFPIAATGSFTGNTYSKVYTGFGKINELTYKSLK